MQQVGEQAGVGVRGQLASLDPAVKDLDHRVAAPLPDDAGRRIELRVGGSQREQVLDHVAGPGAGERVDERREQLDHVRATAPVSGTCR